MCRLDTSHGGEELTFAEGIELYSSWCEAAMEFEEFPAKLKKKLAAESKAYYETGTCNPTKLLKSAAINPTLLDPKTLRWWVEVSSCPFDGYLPLSLSELETTAEGIVTRFCQKKLKTLVTAFRKMRENVKFHFHCGEDLKFCHIGTTEKFDVIDSSSLADDLGLANVLVSCIQRLELNPNSLLLTESLQWASLAPTVLKYVEESLCTPQSMIPTLYGLRLANHVEFGSVTLSDQESPTGCPHITLTWHQAPRLENVSLGSSASLDRILRKLENICYYMEDQKGSPAAEKCGVKCYTPLTYYYVVRHLAQRSGLESGHASLLKFSHSKLAPRFMTTQTILDSLADGTPVKLVTADQPFTVLNQNLFEKIKKLYPAPMLRLILIPPEDYLKKLNVDKVSCPIVWADGNLSVQYIDNFHLHYNKCKDGSFHSVQVSFILPQNYCLKRNRYAVLIELVTGLMVMDIGELQDLEESVVEKFPQTNAEVTTVVASQVPCMQAVCCEESETDFKVKIGIQTNKDDPKGKTLESNCILLN